MPLIAQSWRDLAAEQEDRQIALEHLAEAWNSAENEGIEPESMAHAALFAALATLVSDYGEEAVAELVAALPRAACAWANTRSTATCNTRPARRATLTIEARGLAVHLPF